MARQLSPERATVTLHCRGSELTVVGHRNGYTLSAEREDMLWQLQEVLATLSPDLVVLDLQLPIGFGTKLLDVVRETCPDASVVTHVHSAVGHSSPFSIESGPKGLVLKPLDEGSWPR